MILKNLESTGTIIHFENSQSEVVVEVFRWVGGGKGISLEEPGIGNCFTQLLFENNQLVLYQ